MKIFLDDEHPAPEGWARVFWPEEAIKILETGSVTDISLDHDLGNKYITGNDVIKWIQQAVTSRAFTPPNIIIHSASPKARNIMEQGIENIMRIHRQNKKKSRKQ